MPESFIKRRERDAGIVKRAILPAVIYAISVFAAGFLFGTVRVLLVAPRSGDFLAVLMEAPVMILVSFFFARWIIRRWKVPAEWHARFWMGAVAFTLLMACEILLSLTLFDNTLSQFLSHYGQPQGLLGLGAQLVFAAMPVILLTGRQR